MKEKAAQREAFLCIHMLFFPFQPQLEGGHNGCRCREPALSNQFGGQLCSLDLTATIQLAPTLGTSAQG